MSVVRRFSPSVTRRRVVTRREHQAPGILTASDWTMIWDTMVESCWGRWLGRFGVSGGRAGSLALLVGLVASCGGGSNPRGDGDDPSAGATAFGGASAGGQGGGAGGRIATGSAGAANVDPLGFWTRSAQYGSQYGGSGLFDVTPDWWVVQTTQPWSTEDGGRKWTELESGLQKPGDSELFWILGMDLEHTLLARWWHPMDCETRCVLPVPGNPGDTMLIRYDTNARRWVGVDVLPTELRDVKEMASSANAAWFVLQNALWKFDGAWSQVQLPPGSIRIDALRVSKDAALTILGVSAASSRTAIFQLAAGAVAEEWTEVALPTDRPSSSTFWLDVQVDGDGRLYAIERDTVYRRDGDAWTNITPSWMPASTFSALGYNAAVSASGVMALVSGESNLDNMTRRPMRVWTSNDFGNTFIERLNITDAWIPTTLTFDAQERLMLLARLNNTVVWYSKPASEW